MSAKKWAISAVWCAQESSYGTDPSSNGSGYGFVKVIDPTFQPTGEVIERPGQTNDMTRNTHVIGVKRWSLSFKMELKASGTPAASATAAIASEASPLLEAAWGTVVRGTGSTTAAGTTSSALTVASASGFSKYMAVEVLGEVRFITAISGSVLTLDRALSLGSPANGTVVNAASLFKRATSGHKSVAFVVKRDGIEYTLLGGYVTAKLSGISAKGTAMVEITANGSDWSVTTKGSLPSSDLTGITAVRAPVVKGSAFCIDAVEDLIESFEFDPGVGFEFQTTTTATNAASGIEAVSSAPKGSFKAFYAASHLTDFAAGTERALSIGVGDKTNGFALYVPKAQYTTIGLENVSNGMVGEGMGFSVNDNGTDADWALSVF